MQRELGKTSSIRSWTRESSTTTATGTSSSRRPRSRTTQMSSSSGSLRGTGAPTRRPFTFFHRSGSETPGAGAGSPRTRTPASRSTPRRRSSRRTTALVSASYSCPHLPTWDPAETTSFPSSCSPRMTQTSGHCTTRKTSNRMSRTPFTATSWTVTRAPSTRPGQEPSVVLGSTSMRTGGSVPESVPWSAFDSPRTWPTWTKKNSTTSSRNAEKRPTSSITASARCP